MKKTHALSESSAWSENPYAAPQAEEESDVSGKGLVARGGLFQRIFRKACFLGVYLPVVYCALFCLLMEPRDYAIDSRTGAFSYRTVYRFAGAQRWNVNITWYGRRAVWANEFFFPLEALIQFALPDYTDSNWCRLHNVTRSTEKGKNENAR